MDSNKLLLAVLKAAIRGQRVNWQGRCSGNGWQTLFSQAQVHKVLPLVADAVFTCPDFQDLPENTQDHWKQAAMGICVGQIQRTELFLSLYREMAAAGLRPLVMKGIVCRQTYPDPSLRPSADEDLLLSAAQFAQGAAFLESRGLKRLEPERDATQAFELGFRSPAGLNIELHRSPFSPESDALGEFNALFTGAEERAMTLRVEDTSLLTLSPYDHMLYLLLHAFKHFIHSGFGIRQIGDIILWAEKYGKELDWDRLFAQCAQLRCHRFAAAVFCIGRDYLGFDADTAYLPHNLLEQELPCEELLDDLLVGGIYGSATMNRLHSATITFQAMESSRRGGKGSLLTTLFPPRKHLAANRPYLSRYPFLLPVAWCGRLLGYGKELLRRNSGNTPAESLRIGTERTELLRKLDIIE